MCSMSWSEFLASANDFIELSRKYGDTWSMIKKDDNEGNTYLVYKQKVNISVDEFNEPNELKEVDIEEFDDSSKTTEKNQELFEIEYHVVYSISYQVPVLYFRGNRSDGKPINLEDAWIIFQSPATDAKTRSNMLTTLTQTDHPVLFKPFLGLHPCRTAELLQQMGVSQNMILTFLSLMGPFVKLNLKNEYGLTFNLFEEECS